MKTIRALLLALSTVVGVPHTTVAAEQTTVVHWEFTSGYSETKDGVSAVYTPDESGWTASANQKWSALQPYFLPNISALPQEECRVTLHTSDGKWQLTSSGSTPSYLLRLNTASVSYTHLTLPTKRIV